MKCRMRCECLSVGCLWCLPWQTLHNVVTGLFKGIVDLLQVTTGGGEGGYTYIGGMSSKEEMDTGIQGMGSQSTECR